MPERKVRIRRKKSAGVVTPTKKMEEMVELAKDTETLMAEVLELQEKIRANEKILFGTMSRYVVEKVEGTYGDFVYNTPKGRSSMVIDVNELQARMTPEDFVTVVKPLASEVKNHFSAKEIAEFSETTPGKPGDPVLQYKPKKKK